MVSKGPLDESAGRHRETGWHGCADGKSGAIQVGISYFRASKKVLNRNGYSGRTTAG